MILARGEHYWGTRTADDLETARQVAQRLATSANANSYIYDITDLANMHLVYVYSKEAKFSPPPNAIVPPSYRGSPIWKHISGLYDAIGNEGDDEQLIKLHEQLNGYLFAVLYEQLGDMVKLEDELTKIKNPSILDVLNDVESYIMRQAEEGYHKNEHVD